MVGKLGMSTLEQGLGYEGSEGCTGTLAQMTDDDDKVDQTGYIQARFRSSKPLLKITQTKKKKKKNVRNERENSKMVGFEDGKEKVAEENTLHLLPQGTFRKISGQLRIAFAQMMTQAIEAVSALECVLINVVLTTLVPQCCTGRWDMVMGYG